jgi:hypothetical protein
MLEALISAAESALETKVNSVATTTYNCKTPDWSLMKRFVGSALSSMKVDSHDFLAHSAKVALPGLGLGGDLCEYEIHPPFTPYTEERALVVEFTRVSLSASLWTNGCTLIDCEACTQSNTLNHDALEISQNSGNETSTFAEDFKSALNLLCGSLYETPSWMKEPSMIAEFERTHKNRKYRVDAVLLMGESADNEKMQDLLREVVVEHFSNGASVDFLRTRDISTDPAFVVSRAAAFEEGGIKEYLQMKHRGHEQEL